jgi:eukaryotic-like serine/threonine-protein kinase
VTPERWQHVARIYDLAADLDPVCRDTFLSDACGADEELRREVESLLREDESGVVLDRSVWTTVEPLLRPDCDFDNGAELGPYRIEGRLGAGGMGEVFRATDTRLNRPVAIKVLSLGAGVDQRMRSRFTREAKAVAALTHPHICTLYDIGRHRNTDFLVMECLEGETLAARIAARTLSITEAVTAGVQIASALEHAHRHGIVHRDLKPANIILTPGGAKLLDFGVAKFRSVIERGGSAGEPEADDCLSGAVGGVRPMEPVSDELHVTHTGAVPGTVRYMAPEQVQGDEVDGRTDVFSFGAVMFEMLTGARAFGGNSRGEICEAILHHEPPAVSALQQRAAPLDAVVRRCLAKNPDARWQSAGDLLDALRRASKQIGDGVETDRSVRVVRRWHLVAGSILVSLAAVAVWALSGRVHRAAPTAAPVHVGSIAVLPFQNLSGSSEYEYLADGMTEQLIADLGSISGLRVISRMSAMHYRGVRKPAAAIAAELGVDAIVEAAILGVSGRVRLAAKLIKGSTGDVVWAQTFDRELREVLVLQSEIARAITSRVNIVLTAGEQARLAGAQPVDPVAHRQVLLGRHHAAKGTEDGLKRAVQFFDAAIAQNPASAPAHAGLAEAYTELAGFYLDPREAMPKAKRAAETALSLDGALAEAHAALGYIHLVYDWDGPAAALALKRALELNPTLATARLNYAAYLTTLGRNEEAVREARRAVDLDPLSIRAHTLGTVLLLFTRRYAEAAELARKGLEFEPNSGFTLAFHGVALAEQGRFDEAVANMERAAQLDNSLTVLALQAHVLAVAGRRADAQRILRRIENAARHQYFCPYEIATVYVSLGDQEKAYRLFRKGTEEHADCMAWLGVEPWIDPFRSDPRYERLLRDIGLTPPSR